MTVLRDNVGQLLSDNAGQPPLDNAGLEETRLPDNAGELLFDNAGQLLFDNAGIQWNSETTPSAGGLIVSGHAPSFEGHFLPTVQLASLGIASYPPTATGDLGSTVEIGAVEWTVQYLPVSQSITVPTGVIGVHGYASEVQAHFAATANHSTLRLLSYNVLLFGDRETDPAVGTLRIVGYPPIIVRIRPAARRDFRVNAQDRQMAVAGRRRVFRVGRRGGADAA